MKIFDNLLGFFIVFTTSLIMSKITPRKKDYSKWYNELIQKSQLAEISPIRGCMIIKPYGFAIWEKMQAVLDRMFKQTGHENAYFPLFIPKSYLAKEAQHIDGFAKECAVVTHYRLKNDKEKGNLIIDPKAKLEEELIIRPTSETIIWESYKNWIQSYRDLPILINQWANVVRWEMRTRLFLRTSEFLWQEGHTAHATKEEAIEEAEKMLDVYADFVENFMAMSVIKGIKSPSERFAGAQQTYTIEAIMQDGKALQVGTSHFLGQNFSKAFDVKFTTKSGEKEYVWASSWGISTRLMGALIMTHSDDYGLVLPPKLAPIQVVLIPIYKDPKQLEVIKEFIFPIKNSLEKENISVKFDDKDYQTPGWKFNEYEIKGVPIRIAIGPKDLERKTLEIYRRDLLTKEYIPIENSKTYIIKLLDQIQENLYQKSIKMKNDYTSSVETYDDFKDVLKEKGGFISAHWNGKEQSEEKIKEETKATIRCIPIGNRKEEGKCIYSKEKSLERVLFAKAY